jgi:hypothetical protein
MKGRGGFAGSVALMGIRGACRVCSRLSWTGLIDQLAKLLVVGLDLDRLDGDAVALCPAKDRVLLWIAGAGEVGGDIRAGIAQAARGDQAIAAVVPRSNQNEDAAILDRYSLQNRAGDALPGQFHHLIIAVSRHIGGGFQRSHLRYG